MYEEKKKYTPTTRPDMTSLPVDAGRHVHDRCKKNTPRLNSAYAKPLDTPGGLGGSPMCLT